MSIDLMTIFIVICAMIGVGWAYPRLPSPWNWVLVGVVALVCVVVLLAMGGVIKIR